VGKIATAGLFLDLDIDSYHGEPTVGVSISKSGLAKLTDCPAKYWAESPLNPNRVTRKTAALEFGKAAHAWVLGEPEFARFWFVSPYEKHNENPGKKWWDAWKAKVAAGTESRTVIKSKDLDDIRAMADAIKRTPQTARAFDTKGAAEVSIVWQDEDTGIYLKSRPDFLPADHTTQFTREYKSAVSIEPRRLSNDAFRYFYDAQAALAYDGLRIATGKAPLGIAHIVQEKEPPYLCDLKMFAPEQIDIGRTRYRHALRIFARCLARMKAGDPPHIAFPGYTTEPQFFSTPKWVTDNLMEMDDEPASSGRADEYGSILAAL